MVDPQRTLRLLVVSLMGPGLLTACFDEELALLLEPEDPVFVTADADCWAGQLELEALVDGQPIATNLVVELTDADGLVLETALPVNDLTQADGRVTRWTAALPHDCEQELTLTWTAYTAQGTETTRVTRFPLVPPELEGLQPPYGSTLGGALVTLGGEWLDDVTQVLFGDQAAAVVEVTEEGLVLEAPAHDAGPVDVVVETTGGSSTLNQAFTYYPDQTGMMRGFARPTIFRHDPVNFSIGSPYVQLGTYGPFFQLELSLHEPVPPESSAAYRQPVPGTCDWREASYTPVTPSTYLLLEHAGLGAFAMTLYSGWLYTLVLDAQDPDDWAGEWLDLEIPEGADDLPAQLLQDVVRVPEFLPTSADWLTDNPHVVGEDLTLSWTDDGQHLGLEYWVGLVNARKQTLNAVYCTAVAADEQVVLPWQDLLGAADLGQAAGLVVHWRFWSEHHTVFPHDNSVFWSQGFTDTYTWHPLVNE